MAPRSKYWVIVLSLLGTAVIIVMAILAYLLGTLPEPAGDLTPSAQLQGLSLPTAAAPTAIAGPPVPPHVTFTAQQPIKAFPSCEFYGFRGSVSAAGGEGLPGTQVVMWRDQAGLLAIDTTDNQGNYLIELQGTPARRKLWLQVYQNDVPVSMPLPVETQLDCHNGFQFYQVDWRQIEPK